MPLRLIFMGTPDFAVPTLAADRRRRTRDRRGLYARAKAGRTRGMALQETPVAREAQRLRHSGVDAGDAEAPVKRRRLFARTAPMPPSSSPMG